MNTNQLLNALKQPEVLLELTVSELQEVVDTFPFFSAAHLLLVKKMQIEQHLHFTKTIKRTAVAVNNRKKLYTYLYQTHVQQTIAQSLSETVSEQVAIPVATSVEVIPAITKDENSAVTESSTGNEKDSQSIAEEESKVETTNEQASFSAPIDLKTLSSKPKEEIDALEQQIIGHTIEHMLSQEISNKYPAQQKNEAPPANDGPVKDSQKFSEWLEILDHKRLAKQRAEKDDQLSEANIIDSFLNKNINIISPTNDEMEFSPNNLARLSATDDDEFVTETLANIYASQGNFDKAIDTFNKLIAKYPEKKTYFAGRIRKIEQEKNK